MFSYFRQSQLFQYEYWPIWVFYAPLIPFYLYQSLRNRSLTFATLANPAIDMGGLLGNSKYSILQKIDPEYLPKTLFVPAEQDLETTLFAFALKTFEFPVIAKPDVGERGFKVEFIKNEIELKNYYLANRNDFLIQEFIDYPLEIGVFYSRLPSQTQGKISSVTRKEFLTVTGDGRSTISQLMQQSARAQLQIESTSKKMGFQQMQCVLPKDTVMLIEPIGNHCRGTKFLNGHDLINNTLEKVFDSIAQPFEGFYYGRFDLKVASLTDLYQGKHIKILELNGINSEPTHIYDPNYKLFDAYRDVLWHWRRAESISREVKKMGYNLISFSDAFRKTLKYVKHKKS